MRRLVILRPEPGASSTAERARSLGLEPLVLPLFTVEPVEWSAPDPARFDALLITSANAIRQGGDELGRVRALPAHCVGAATATVAAAAGLRVATVGEGRVDSLLASLPGELRLLHLCGVHRREPASPRQSITPIAVYCSAELPPPEDLSVLEDTVIAVHSPRAGDRLDEISRASGLDRPAAAIAAISPEAAEAAGAGWGEVESASEPSERALLALAARLCNKPAR